MKSKKKGLLLALVLAMLIGGAITVYATLDLSQKCSITFMLGTDNTAYNNDLTLDKVNIKLYQVATATANDRDSYDFVVSSEFSHFVTADQLINTDAKDLPALAETLKGASENLTEIPYSNGEKSLEAGCYLAVIPDVETDAYKYTFSPMLISVPQGESADTTAGGMNFDVSVVLKASQDYRTTDVNLTKNFESFNTSLGPVTVVFRVAITYPDLLTQENVVDERIIGLTFDENNLTKTYTIKDIPVGASVFVKEEYTGASYSTNESEVSYVVVSPNLLAEGETQTIGFNNFYNNKLISGHGVVNHFEHDGSSWHWTKSSDSQ